MLAGTLEFTFADGSTAAAAGSTVFVPAGVAHAYTASNDARYLIILTPRLRELIAALHGAPLAQHAAILRQYQSELLA